MPTDSLDLVKAYYLITKCLLPFLLYVMYVMQWIALMSVLVELCIFSGWFRLSTISGTTYVPLPLLLPAIIIFVLSAAIRKCVYCSVYINLNTSFIHSQTKLSKTIKTVILFPANNLIEMPHNRQYCPILFCCCFPNISLT